VDYVASHQDVPVSGLGGRLRQRLYDLVNTGHIDTHAALLDEVGEPMATLLGIEGWGRKQLFA
jgi:DNA polymerase/3'-5' exonuclease PolX